MQKMHMATMDIKSAYLNATLPPDADWIITTLEPNIAEVCALDPSQEYRICNALYGLPDSGRLFYLHFKAALLTEGYSMSALDNCLFCRTTATEKTYIIIVYVDDTFIFSNSAANIDAVITSISNHYEVTLDRGATNFLGLTTTRTALSQSLSLNFYSNYLLSTHRARTAQTSPPTPTHLSPKTRILPPNPQITSPTYDR